jgi:hypothetical protein
VLAALLGLIPGVGAMYNGQFAKGIVHLAIFAVLMSLSDVHSIFGFFVVGWWFYMVFEAYHTAVARRDGLPLPNAFGFNDIGERMGFGKSWGSVKPEAGGAAQTPYSAPATANPVAGPAYTPVNPVPVGTAPDWVGYVPPTAFGGHAAPTPEATAASMAAQIQAQAMKDAGYGHAPYSETYIGAPPAYGTAFPPAAPPTPEIAARRFPSGAIWLIALGVLILMANLLPDWKLTAQWWAPIFLAGLSIWLFTRRLRTGAKLVCIIRWPVILMVLAVLLALHAAYVPVTIGLTASVLLIALGALLLLERTAGASPAYEAPIATPMYPATPYPGAASVADVPPGETPQRAAWAAPESEGTRNPPDDTKGGQ